VLRTRIFTALVLGPLIIGVLFFLPESFAVAFFAAMYLVGAWEWAGFLQCRGQLEKAGFTLAGAVCLGLVGLLDARGYGPWLLSIAIPAWLLGLFWVLRFPVVIGRWLAAAFGLLIISLAWLGVTTLLHDPSRGPQWVLFAFCVVWSADVGAYIVGRTLGRHKLAPLVSPGKTWEGVAGGVVACAVVGYAGSIWFSLAPQFLVPLTVLCGAVSVIGDLTVSVFKRKSGLKDSGWILPGHGGILDRMDSLTAASPLLALGLILAGSPS
jgi:phosphatidate cytidylyltransferase